MFILNSKDAKHCLTTLLWPGGGCYIERKPELAGYGEKVLVSGKEGIGKTVALLRACSLDKHGYYMDCDGLNFTDFVYAFAKYFAIPISDMESTINSLKIKLTDKTLYLDNAESLVRDKEFAKLIKHLKCFLAVQDNGTEIAKSLNLKEVKIHELSTEEFNDLIKCLTSASPVQAMEEELEEAFSVSEGSPLWAKMWSFLPPEERSPSMKLDDILNKLIASCSDTELMLLSAIYPVPMRIIGFSRRLSKMMMEINDVLEDIAILPVHSCLREKIADAKERRKNLADKLSSEGYTIPAVIHYLDAGELEKAWNVLSVDLSSWPYIPPFVFKKLGSKEPQEDWEKLYFNIAKLMSLPAKKVKLSIKISNLDWNAWVIVYLADLSTRGEYIGKRISAALKKMDLDTAAELKLMLAFLEQFIDGRNELKNDSSLSKILGMLLDANRNQRKGKRDNVISIIDQLLPMLGKAFTDDPLVSKLPTLVAGIEMLIATILEKIRMFEYAEDVRELATTHLLHLVDTYSGMTGYFVLWAWNEIKKAENMLSRFKRPDAKILLNEIYERINARDDLTTWSVEHRWLIARTKQLLSTIIVVHRDRLDSLSHSRVSSRNYRELLYLTGENLFHLHLAENTIWEGATEFTLESRNINAIHTAIEFRDHGTELSNHVIERLVSSYIQLNVYDEYSVQKAGEWLVKVLQDIPREIGISILLLSANEILHAAAGMKEKVWFPRSNLAGALLSLMPSLVNKGVPPGLVTEAIKILSKEAKGKDKTKTVATLCAAILMGIRTGHPELEDEFVETVKKEEVIPDDLRKEILAEFAKEKKERRFAKTLSLIQQLMFTVET